MLSSLKCFKSPILDDSDDDDESDELFSYQPFSQESTSSVRAAVSPSMEKSKQSASQETKMPAATVDEIAKRKVQHIPLPTSVKSTSELHWYRFTSRKVKKLLPCRICEYDEGVGLDLPQDWDSRQKVLIQRLGHFVDNDREVVSRRQVFPYHNADESNTHNDNQDDKNKWCPKLIALYTIQLRKQKMEEVKIKTELLFLGRILEHAQKQERDAAAEEEKRLQEKLQMEEEEESSPQPWKSNGNNENAVPNDHQAEVESSDEDDEVDERIARRKTELIRAGDVIEYSSHVFVDGDERGYRMATVISVDPRRSPVLVLDNGDFLEVDTWVRRKYIMHRGKLKEHDAAMYRRIDDYKLHKSGTDMSVAAGVVKQANVVGEILEKNFKEFEKKAKADGFAPMDLMNRYGRKNRTKTKKDGREAKVPETNTVPLDEDSPKRKRKLEKQGDNEITHSSTCGPKAAKQPTPARGDEWVQKLEAELSTLAKEAKSTKRRRSASCHMTKEQLQLALEVRRCFQGLSSQESLGELSEELGISSYALQKFLEGDEARHIRAKQHEETETLLRKWMEKDPEKTAGGNGNTAVAAKLSPAKVTQDDEESDDQNKSEPYEPLSKLRRHSI